jgi:hypothetical protein
LSVSAVSSSGRGLAYTSVGLQDLVDEKEVGEQRTQMDRGVQVIDQLRADGDLRENNLNGGQGVAGVPFQHREECEVWFGGKKFLVSYRRRIGLRHTGKSGNRAGQVLSHLAIFFTRETLAGIAEHEFVALFDGIATGTNVFAHRLGQDFLRRLAGRIALFRNGPAFRVMMFQVMFTADPTEDHRFCDEKFFGSDRKVDVDHD